jgi:hypothetical protein
MVESKKISENSEGMKRIAMFEDERICIDEIIFNKNIDIYSVNEKGVIRSDSFPIGFASVQIRDELKCYFAIKVRKTLLDELNEALFYQFMGSSPFILSVDEENVVYLRSSIPYDFLPRKEANSTLSSILNDKKLV